MAEVAIDRVNELRHSLAAFDPDNIFHLNPNIKPA